MLAAISPCCRDYEETLSTLKYMERAKSVVNIARVNHHSNSSNNLDLVDALRREILELKAKLQHTPAAIPSPSPSMASSSTIRCPSPVVKGRLALDLDSTGSEVTPQQSATDNEEGALTLTAVASSPLFTTSVCFDEKEKAKWEREVAKLKVQLRKKDRAFQLQQFTTKALGDKVAAQVLRQHTQLIDIVGIHKRFVACLKFRALERWRYCCSSNSIAATPGNQVAEMLDKNVMTDAESNNNNNNSIESSTSTYKQAAPVTWKWGSRTKGDDAAREDDPAVADNALDDPRAYAKKNPHYQDLTSDRLGRGGLVQVDVLCSSVVNDFFGVDNNNNSILMSNRLTEWSTGKTNSAEKRNAVLQKKEDRHRALVRSKSTENNQLEQLATSKEYDPTDNAPVEEATEDESSLIDQIICHDAESNQIHEDHVKPRNGSNLLLQLAEFDPLALEDNEDDDDDDADHDDSSSIDESEDCREDGTLDSPRRALSPATQAQRILLKLSRCLDAVDIARKTLGPTMRKLKQITDKSTQIGSGAIDTGMERQLLRFVDNSLVVVNQHFTDLHAEVPGAPKASLNVAVYAKLDQLVSDFCLQTMGHVCDQLTNTMGASCVAMRLPVDNQLNRFQVEMKELLALLLAPDERTDGCANDHRASLTLVLVELFALSERIRFAWYAIDQKSRQRLVQVTARRQLLEVTKDSVEQWKTQASELQAQCGALRASLESQTAEFAKREEEDRLALLMSTHNLEEEHAKRVDELEKQLLVATTQIETLEEQLLAQVSKVELLEQELELTVVVRSTNELLRRRDPDHVNFDSSNSNNTSDDALTPHGGTQCANIIVKLEEELATALIQINELENGASADNGDATESSADLEMIQYMRRTSEIEKQNSEAISQWTTAMGHEHGVATTESHDDHRLAGLRNTAVTLNEKLTAALSRAEILEDQHLKLMVSYEHLEDHLYEAETTITELREKVNALQADTDDTARQRIEPHGAIGVLQGELQFGRCFGHVMRLEDRNTELEVLGVVNDVVSCVAIEANGHKILRLRVELKASEHELQLSKAKWLDAESVSASQGLRTRSLESELQASVLEVQSLQHVFSELTSTKKAVEQLENQRCEMVAALEEARAIQNVVESKLKASEDTRKAFESRCKMMEVTCAELAVKANFEQDVRLNTELDDRNTELEVRRVLSEMKSSVVVETSDYELARLKVVLGTTEQELQVSQASLLDAQIELTTQGRTISTLESELQAALRQVRPPQQASSELEGQRAELVATLEETRAHHDLMESRLMATEKFREALESEVAEMQKRLNEASAQTAELQRRYQTEFERNAAHETRLNAVSEELHVALAKYHALEMAHDEQAASYRDDVSQLQHQLILVDDQVNSLETAKATLESQLTLQADQVLRLEDCRHEAEVAAKNLEMIIAGLRQKETTLHADSDAIRQQNVELQDAIDALQRGLQVAYTTAAELEERICDSTIEPSLTQANDLVMALEEQLEAARERNTELEVRSVLHEVTSSIADRHELSQMEANLGSAQHELQISQAESAAQRFVIRALKSKLEAALLQVESLQHAPPELVSAVATVRQLEAQHSELEAALEKAIMRQDIAESRLVASEERSEALESHIRAIKADLAKAQSQVTELQVRLDEASAQTTALQSSYQSTRELNAAQGTKLNAVLEELRIALEECHALEGTHATQEASQRDAMSQLQQKLVVADDQVTTLKSQIASHMARVTVLQQECESKAAAMLALKSEYEEAIASLNNNISVLETQLGHLKHESSRVKSENNEQSMTITSQQERIVSLELEIAAASTEYCVLQERLRDCELDLAYRKEQAHDTSDSQNTITLLQAEHDAQALAITQHHDEERQRMQETYEQELISVQNELMAVNSREVNALQTKVCALQADLDTKLLELHELQASEQVRMHHQQELMETQSKIYSLREELEAATLAVDCAESKNAALKEQHSAQMRTAQDDLHEAQRKLKQLDEDHILLTEKFNSQTLALSALEEALVTAKTRVSHHENEARISANEALKYRVEIKALQARIRAMEAEVGALGDTRYELERQVNDKETEIESLRGECARLANEYDLQTSLLIEQQRDEIREATAQVHKEWELKYHTQREELQTLEGCVTRVNHELAAREQLVQSLKAKVADVNSNHASELQAWETKFHDKIVELQREIETRTPDEIRKLRAQVEAASARADDFEMTYKVELENNLQLEFDLASVQKELHLTKQQLSAHDPLQTERHALEERMLRLKERENELHDCEQTLLMHCRTSGIEVQEQQVKQCDDDPSSRVALEVRIRELTQRLQEADCRSAMQVEELHSYRSWVTLQEVLRRALANGGSNDVYIDHTTTPEAKRLVMKHLHSLDNWFDCAILRKSVQNDRHSESLDTITEGSELSELQDTGDDHGEGAGSCSEANATPRRLLRPRDNHVSESNDSDVSDCDEAVPVDLDDLGDELLAMCDDENAQQHPDQFHTVDTGKIVPHAPSYTFCTEASDRRGSGGFGYPSGSGDPKDAQIDVAQLKLTILRLKEVLDAKEETILFLDDKMKYYEELLNASSQS
uniref:Kinesin motor domain-containing protein n=1 Tax=Globisporangium ultimum (strain ATCC 200006 / CBS 805.95 / DAOM BR144) TaxID=431595 RepID=K3WHP1_GLOUD